MNKNRGPEGGKRWQKPSCLVNKMYYFVSSTEYHESRIVEGEAVLYEATSQTTNTHFKIFLFSTG